MGDGSWQHKGSTPCRVSHEALRDLADRVHFGGPDEKVFEAYRELVEQVASDAYDAGTSVDDAGLVLVTSEALAPQLARLVVGELPGSCEEL
jgi:hypothetical protein